MSEYKWLKISSNLPLCPVCRDTKQVKECSVIKCLPGLISHKCEACKVYWEGRINKYEI